METSQGNYLYSYLKQTKISFYFFFHKIADRRAELVLSGELVPVGRCGERM
jgi:hypothetical protein